MAIQSTVFRITGKAPLLMHNGSLADPTNPIVKAMKAITGNRKKTDEQYEQLALLEFRGGLYLNREGKVIVPSAVIEGSIRDGAKKSKLGKQFASAVMVNDDAILDYGDDLTPEEMFAQRERFVSTMAVRVEKTALCEHGRFSGIGHWNSRFLGTVSRSTPATSGRLLMTLGRWLASVTIGRSMAGLTWRNESRLLARQGGAGHGEAR